MQQKAGKSDQTMQHKTIKSLQNFKPRYNMATWKKEEGTSKKWLCVTKPVYGLFHLRKTIISRYRESAIGQANGTRAFNWDDSCEGKINKHTTKREREKEREKCQGRFQRTPANKENLFPPSCCRSNMTFCLQGAWNGREVTRRWAPFDQGRPISAV